MKVLSKIYSRNLFTASNDWSRMVVYASSVKGIPFHFLHKVCLIHNAGRVDSINSNFLFCVYFY